MSRPHPGRRHAVPGSPRPRDSGGSCAEVLMTSSVAGPGVPESKVRPPASPADVVARPRLTAQLDAATGAAAVTLLCAPAGTGKTLLLAEWARTAPTATAWVSL